MGETLTLVPEQVTEPSVEVIECLGQPALQGAISAADRGGFTLSEETTAELEAVFNIERSEELPLSAHGLSCVDTDDNGDYKSHSYLLPGYKPVAE